jgi:hypothetical protein
MTDKREIALTVGAIAHELAEPLHRVQYAIKTRGIDPAARAGHIRVFGDDAVERIADILREIGRKKPLEARQSDRSQGGAV